MRASGLRNKVKRKSSLCKVVRKILCKREEGVGEGIIQLTIQGCGHCMCVKK
jgi:hypothetical protein